MPAEELQVEREWYALRVKSQYEKPVAAALLGKEIEAYLPLYVQRRTYSRRIREVRLPLFPGYVFARFVYRTRLPVLTIPGVVQIVGAGNFAQPVAAAELAAVRRLLESNLFVQPWPFLQAGERVRIVRGPLRDLEGFVIQVKRAYRVVLSVTILQRSAAVEVDRGCLQRLPAIAPPVGAPAPSRPATAA